MTESDTPNFEVIIASLAAASAPRSSSASRKQFDLNCRKCCGSGPHNPHTSDGGGGIWTSSQPATSYLVRSRYLSRPIDKSQLLIITAGRASSYLLISIYSRVIIRYRATSANGAYQSNSKDIRSTLVIRQFHLATW